MIQVECVTGLWGEKISLRQGTKTRQQWTTACVNSPRSFTQKLCLPGSSRSGWEVSWVGCFPVLCFSSVLRGLWKTNFRFLNVFNVVCSDCCMVVQDFGVIQCLSIVRSPYHHIICLISLKPFVQMLSHVLINLIHDRSLSCRPWFFPVFQ